MEHPTHLVQGERHPHLRRRLLEPEQVLGRAVLRARNEGPPQTVIGRIDCILFISSLAHNAEVDKLQTVECLIYQNVLGLDVTVNQPVVIEILDRGNELAEQGFDTVNGRLWNGLFEVFPINVLHLDEASILLQHDLDYFDQCQTTVSNELALE